MPLINARHIVSCIPAIVTIGCRYRGPCSHFDGEKGTYWEVLPEMGGDAERLQKGLLKQKESTKNEPMANS